MYLLAKKLPHTLVSGENEKFKELLKDTKAEEIVRFAEAVGREAQSVDGKVCKKKVWKALGGSQIPARDEAVDDENGRWSCTDYVLGAEKTHNATKDLEESRGFMWRFGDASRMKIRGDTHAGNNTDASEANIGRANGGWPGTGSGKHDTAHGMADDLSKTLNRTERNKVAGLLSKTVSGAEVVEIRAVSTTSVMLNACYDCPVCVVPLVIIA